jgi:hypothetical protein
MSTSAPTNLPTIDEWMGMRAMLVTVLGEQPATTLLTVLPPIAEGGFATNNRVDLLDLRVNARFDRLEASMIARFDQAEARTNSRFEQVNSRFEQVEARTNSRFDKVDARFDKVDARLDHLENSTTARFAHADERLRSEISGLRSDLTAEITRSASDNLKSMRAMFLQLVGVMCTMGGLVIAAAKFL